MVILVMYLPIDVETGAVRTICRTGVIKSSGLGSCVAVTAYDPLRRIGGIAHIMLPGLCTDNKHSHPLRYCENALDELFRKLANRGSPPNGLVVCLAGGANVLRRKNCTIGKENIKNIFSYLSDRDIPVQTVSLGGYLWRSVQLDVETGEIFCREAGDFSRLLWPPDRNKIRSFRSFKPKNELASVAGA